MIFMSSKNIFEVLQKIAENPESNEKFLNILKENGFTGTLEEAENQINQQTQVVLNNLTTEDLQNIAGGKSLMNDKLKKALAVGGASLMAAGTVMPSGSAQGIDQAKKTLKKYTNTGVDYVTNNPVHTALTAIFGLTAATLFAKSVFGGRPDVHLPFKNNNEMWAYLAKKDLTKNKDVAMFIHLCVSKMCRITLVKDSNPQKLQVNGVPADLLKDALWGDASNPSYTVDDFLLKLVVLMDAKTATYIENKTQALTAEGAEVLNNLQEFLLSVVSYAIAAETEGDNSTNEDNEQKFDEEEKVDENTDKMTMLKQFADNLVEYANNQLDEVNNIEVKKDDNNTDRHKFVTDLTDNNGKKFNDSIAGFANFEDLKAAEILSAEVIGRVQTVIATALDEVAQMTKKAESVDENKNKVKEAIEKMFEDIRKSLEKKGKKSVVKKDNDMPVENKSKTPVTLLKTTRKFQAGDKVTSKPASNEKQDN